MLYNIKILRHDERKAATFVRYNSNYHIMSGNSIQIYFCDNKSVYKSYSNCDCYDEKRDALTTKSQEPAVYHPPCRTWSRLRAFSIEHPGEHLLAVWSVLRIWRYGGVLEHPAYSSLWKTMNLPYPGKGYDSRGGFSISINQSWFNFPCEKHTWLYIKGCKINDLPIIPLSFNAIEKTISTSKKRTGKKQISKSLRSRSTNEFCEYLISICNLIKSK